MAAEIRIIVGQQGAGSAVADAKKDVAELGTTAEKSGGGFSVLKEIGIGALRELGAAATNAALGGLKAFAGAVMEGISDAREAAKINAQTGAVLKSTGNAAGTSAQHVQDYAAALSAAAGKSLFGDSQIQESTNLLLTFTNIKGTVLDAATAISVDMAQALGGAPKDSAIQLGKALNDPIKGVTALTRVGVTFSQEQKDMIQALVDTGDVAGAQKIILAELSKEFGGSAEAAAKADGGWAQFNDRLGEAKETVGAALLPILGQLAGFLNDTIAPAIEAFAGMLTESMPGAIDTLSGVWTGTLQPVVAGFADFLQTAVLPTIGTLMGWFQANLPIAIQTVSGFWTGTLQPAIDTVIATFRDQVMPILQNLATALFPLVGAAIQILAGYWENVLKPALTTAWAIFTTLILPILADVAKWLAENLPPAIQATADFLTNTLFPALGNVYGFINTNVIPILTSVVQWLRDNIPPAIQTAADFWNNTLHPALSAVWEFITNSVIPVLTTLAMNTFTAVTNATQSVSDFWNNVLLPALNAVWGFLNTYVIPLFSALANITIALVKKELQLLSAVWTGVLQPALNSVWTFITTNLTPAITWLNDNVLKPLDEILKGIAFFILGTLKPYLADLGTTINGNTSSAFSHLSGIAGDVRNALGDIGRAVESVIGWLNDLASTINSIDIPDWLEGHSPPPMANWFSDISAATRQLANVDLPELSVGLAATAPLVGQFAAGAATVRAPERRTTYNQQRDVSATFNYFNTNNPPTIDSSILQSLAGV